MKPTYNQLLIELGELKSEIKMLRKQLNKFYKTPPKTKNIPTANVLYDIEQQLEVEQHAKSLIEKNSKPLNN